MWSRAKAAAAILLRLVVLLTTLSFMHVSAAVKRETVAH
jgi:hypothetical protein